VLGSRDLGFSSPAAFSVLGERRLLDWAGPGLDLEGSWLVPARWHLGPRESDSGPDGLDGPREIRGHLCSQFEKLLRPFKKEKLLRRHRRLV